MSKSFSFPFYFYAKIGKNLPGGKFFEQKNIRLRYEQPSDYKFVEELTREAFWNRYMPGCDEHYLLHILRERDCFIPGLDMVAEHRRKIVGNIVYSKAKLLCDNGETREVLTFGPISVLPSCQRKGIGTLLIEHTKVLAGKMGYKAILIYGDPDYYSRFGFIKAERYKIGTPDNMYVDALQALELFPGALYGCAGRFQVDPVFSIDAAAAEEFDKQFEHKERRDDLPSQEHFRLLSSKQRPRFTE